MSCATAAQEPAAFDGGEVSVQVADFGVGEAARAGSWVGLRVEVLDGGLERRNVIVRVEGVDADGDRPLYDRVVTTNPGQPQSFWVYARLPYGFDAMSTATVSVLEAIDAAGDAEAGQLAFRAGRVLGRAQAGSQRVMPPTASFVGVVGSVEYGLRAYQVTTGQGDYPPLGHEVTVVASGLTAATLPDRWHGLGVLDALVWGRGADETDPGALSAEQARAIEEWVQRGGHLVVVLPAVGQEWTSQASNRLRRLLPAMGAPRRIDGASGEAYRALLTTSRTKALPGSLVVQELMPEGSAAAGEAVPVLVGPSGEVLALRRLIGSGAVTVVGMDLGAAALRAAGLPEAEAFWHRVLGRRGDLATVEQIEARDAGRAGVRVNTRSEVRFDDDIGSVIAKQGRAIQGVLLGFILFVLYWAVAGPVSYVLLKRRGKHQLSWLAFLGAVGVFTAIAWSGAALLRPKQVSGVHLTLYEEVAGQGLARARSWVSVLVPSYGEATLAVPRGGESAEAEVHNLLSAWEPPTRDFALAQTFPDNRGYRLEARSPDRMRVPSRSTVKQVQIDWAGEPAWGEKGIAVVAEPGDPVELRAAGDADNREVLGRLVHGLPGALTDVTVVVVRRQETLRATPSNGRMLAVVRAFSVAGEWKPGDVLDLARVTEYWAAADRAASVQYFTDLLSKGRLLDALRPTDGDLEDRLTGVWFFSQLAPPTLESSLPPGDRLARRYASQGYDLGRWFTQPSVIVVGHLVLGEGDASAEASPAPLTLGGKRVPMSGRTVYAWVYPLEAAPPAWAGTGDAVTP